MTGVTTLPKDVPIGVAEIVHAIEEEIVTQQWKPGTKLPSERTLATQCGVSRPVIREALRALNERGLISVAPGKGSFVRALNPTGSEGSADLLVRRAGARARDLVAARLMLESEAAALAALHRTDEELAQMRDILAAFHDSTVPRAADLDLAFHESIAVASHNPVLQVMFGSIRSLSYGLMLRSLTDREVRGAAAPLHEVILDAIAAQDADAARAAMIDHVGAAQRFYGKDLDLPLAEVLRNRADSTPSLATVLRETSRLIAEMSTPSGAERDTESAS